MPRTDYDSKNSKTARIPYSTNELFGCGPQRSFSGESLREVAFPLGGIGTGTVSLGGRGQLRDWEIFNRPGKGKGLPYTFAAIYAKAEGSEPVARVLESRLQPPYAAGGGLSPTYLSGLPRLDDAKFYGEYPFAHIDFKDKTLPVKVSLDAFNPFIPMNDKDSGIPCAILTYTVENKSSKPADVTICFSLYNAAGYDGILQLGSPKCHMLGQNLNEYVEEKSFRGLRMSCAKYSPDSKEYGTMAIVTPHRDVTVLPRWEHPKWWDDLQEFWDDFRTDGVLDDNGLSGPTDDKVTAVGSLGLRVRLRPGESAELPFILTWHFPNRDNHWDGEECYSGKIIGNYYATIWKDAWDVASYTVKNLDRLRNDTRLFQKEFFSSTLPSIVLDAASANMSIMRTNTCLRTSDGRFHAFEGCSDNQGCCPMNCTHVWNYEQAVAFLFPALERSMRLTDYTNNVLEDGKMAFRTKLPLGSITWDFYAAADGQMGCVLKLYREWLLSGDINFLKQLYPFAKRSIEYAWVEWDKDRDGVMEGIQHNTYDIEFQGPNTMMGTLYLAALLAMEKLAVAVNDTDFAKSCREVRENGQNKYEEIWNGEFYIQKYDPSEIKRHQFGSGCLSDQMLGQWFARVVGLGYVLPEDRVKSALKSVFKYNWKSDLSYHNNVQRVYALNDEAGLLLCTWPKGGRPKLPFAYSDEVWTGIEYQVAAHLIYEGFVEEGLAIVKGVRDRHDGIRRNPWNEFECGHHYARAMSSWSLITALSGFHYSAPEKTIAFSPSINQEKFRCFFSAGMAWGSYSQQLKKNTVSAAIAIKYGKLKLDKAALKKPANGDPKSLKATAKVNDASVSVHLASDEDKVFVCFDKTVVLNANDTVNIKLSW